MAEGSGAAKKTPRGVSATAVSAPGKKVMNVLSEMHKSVLNKPRETDDSMEVGTSKGKNNVEGYNTSNPYSESFQNRAGSARIQNGHHSEWLWSQHSQDAVETGQSQGFLALMQANACVNPGVFRGGRHENFEEFLRRFKRKYRGVIRDDEVLIEILGDDHLEGRAKSVFLALPEEIKARGFESVTEALKRLLANDSIAGRLRALTDLRQLKRREGQSVADFCVVLEKLGRQANPTASVGDRSLEYAQILMDNLRGWPEHTQLLTAIHRVEPQEAYSTIKQLALSIEQSKEMLGGEDVTKRYSWKKRYQFHEHGKELQEHDEQNATTMNSRTDMSRGVEPDQNIATKGVAWKKPSTWSGKPAPRERPYTGLGRPDERGGTDQRRCFNCRRYGHIGRECPYKRAQVNQIERTKGFLQSRKQDNLTEVIGKATSLGLKVYRLDKSVLVGEKCAAQLNMLNLQVPAILDTGSMISIVPVGVLARAKKAGYDVDVLEVISDRELSPVYDASANKMNFLGAVKIPVQVEGGRKSIVAFHISDVKDDDILIGTNALAALGVDIILRTDETQRNLQEGKRVVATKRVYIPPYNSMLVPARCEGRSELKERVVWPNREGLSAGVFTVRNQELDIPFTNNSENPLILREGEELGQWGTEKWRTKWEEMNPLMMDSEIPHLGKEERRNILHAQLREGSKVEELDEDLKHLIDEFEEAFAVADTELTGTDKTEMSIDTGDAKPIKMKTRPVPLGIRKKLKELLEDLESRKIIEKSSSAWAFPIVLVEKKDGTLRLCVDYRELNKRIKLDSYPLPTIDAVLQSLAGKKFFSTLDLCSGYWQIPLAQEAREKSAFTTTEGLFQFRVTPFGLSTSPAVFQRLMDSVLRDVLGDEVFCYIDDIIICTDTRKRHFELLSKVFRSLQEAGLRLKAKKCVLLQEKVAFLGHVIDSEGVHMDPKKVEAIEGYVVPSNSKELRTFLGMASYYRKFCLGFSKLASSLFALTSPKAAWKWSAEHEEAFTKLKKMIASAPVLMQPNIEKARDGSRPFVICTDASTVGLGAVLSQEGDDGLVHPVYFASKGLSKAEKRYHITDLEALAVVFAVRRFHMFIYGLPTIVLTDHQPLTALFNRSNVSARVLRWSLEMQRYNLVIKYVKGKTNVVADALSRGSIERGAWETADASEAVVSRLEVEQGSRWLKELEKDEIFGRVITMLEKGELGESIKIPGLRYPIQIADFEIESGELKMYQEEGNLVMVVPKSARYEVFHEAHAGNFAGHFSAHKLWNRLKKQVFWPDMLADISRWTKECQRCFLHNPRATARPPLKPIITEKPYEIIGVDVLELGLTTSGNRYAVTVIDHFSKYAAAYPVPDKTAETIAKVLFIRWIAEGCRWPKTILSDKGGEFENKVMAELTKITKIEHLTTKGYNPRENGITERLNGTILAMLRKSLTIPVEWDARLPFCMMAYNLTPHSATGESPYFMLHGMDPNFPSAVIPSGGFSWYSMVENIADYKAQLLQAVAEAHERVKEYNDRVRREMKRLYDNRNRVDVAKLPRVGDRVYLLSPKEKGMSTHPKLVSEWAGPFRVIETSQNSALITRIGENAEPLRVQFDMLRIVPKYISDEPVDTVTKRGKRGRKPKVSVKKVTMFSFRGAVIASKTEKGHLEYQCKDGCLNRVCLGELEGIKFPGALAKEPIGTLWNAWKAASIFARTDIDMASKIKFWKDGAVCMDPDGLRKLLRVAYKRCIDWTEFICENEGIRRHERIDNYEFDRIYDAAFRRAKVELEGEEQGHGPVKEGGTAFAAPASALLLERDGPKRGILTRVATTFRQLREVLQEWKEYRTWVIVWPRDQLAANSDLCEVMKMCVQQFEEGGKVVTVWPPILEKIADEWKKLTELWEVLDQTLLHQAKPGQCIVTAGTKVEEGKIMIEAGAPEGCLFYYSASDIPVACAKILYEAVRRRAAKQMTLPELKRNEPPLRASAPEGGSMWRSGPYEKPAKRSYGGNFRDS